MKRPIIFLAMALTIGGASPALAHEASGMAGGLLAGFMHPLSGPDHLLAMVAVGLWGAFLGRPLIVLLPVVFPTVMTVGGILGMLGTPMVPVELGIAFSVLVLGAAVAVGWRAPVWLAALLVGIFAIFHGYAHGSELPSMADPVAFSLGFVVATGLLHVAGIGIGALIGVSRGAIGLRVLGGAIALAGCYYLALASGMMA